MDAGKITSVANIKTYLQEKVDIFYQKFLDWTEEEVDTYINKIIIDGEAIEKDLKAREAALKDDLSEIRQHGISCEVKELRKNLKLYKKQISKMIKSNGRRHRRHTSTTLDEVISRKRLRQQEAAAGESSGKRARADLRK